MSSPNPHAIDADTLSGMKPLRKVVYSIGSNLGDRLGNVRQAGVGVDQMLRDGARVSGIAGRRTDTGKSH